MQIFELIKDNWYGNGEESLRDIEMALSKLLNRRYALSINEKTRIRSVIGKMKVKWNQQHRIKEKFVNKCSDWLSKRELFMHPGEPQESTTEASLGRPLTDFSSASDRTKRRRVQSLRKDISPDEMTYATQMNFRADGKSDAAAVMKHMCEGTPTTAKKYRSRFNLETENTLSAESALSVMLQLKLSKNDYQFLRNTSVSNQCRMYPSYNKVSKARKACYPPVDELEITETSAELSLQLLLDITVRRLLILQEDVLDTLSLEELNHLELICKWGCDGSSGRSKYKQTLISENGEEIDDSSIFFTSLVPLQLITRRGNSTIVVWKNPLPSSTRFCRPIKLNFHKETSEFTSKIVEDIKNQISSLVAFENNFRGQPINVTYKLCLTMLDVKIINVLTDTTSAMRCYLCGATSKEFNNLDNIMMRPIIEEFLQYGISSLHAWIRFLECCSSVAYRLDVKKWQIRENDTDTYSKCEKRKQKIQEDFRVKMSLIVDQPKQTHGSSNDGNTARRFFQNAEVSASITGLDVVLLKRLHNILQVLSCGFDRCGYIRGICFGNSPNFCHFISMVLYDYNDA